jgi:hypothetical protein
MKDKKDTSRQPPAVDRRGFWRSLAGEVMATGDEARGIPQQSLRNIGEVPDDVMVEMVPVWMGGREPEVREDGLYLHTGKARRGIPSEMKRVHAFAAYERIMVDQYACGRNLGMIARHVARASGIGMEEAFIATRVLFVRLCEMGLCHPGDAHLQDEEGE